MAGTNISIGGDFSNGNIIVGDKNLIMQVGGNLIFNAAEYIERRQRRDLRKMLRVLVMLSAPVIDPRHPDKDLAPLDLQAEWNRLAEAVRASGAPIALIHLLPPTLDALRYALSPRAVEQGLYPHVLHFSGHAWSEGLLLEDEYSQCDPVTTPRLMEALKDAPPLDLAVFNACESAEGALSAAQAFVNAGRARAALGHPEPVLDDDAVRFAACLYAEMARGGYTLREAFTRAKESVSTHVPRLFGGDDLRFTAAEPGEPLTDARRAPGNLPARERFFFGRGRELVTLARTLEKTPCAAIISGVSGMGKTALALEAAHRNAWRFAGGIAFGDGRGAPLADLLLRDMALGLELPLQTGQKPEEPLLAYARQTPTLFLLDNLEDLPQADLKRLAAFLHRLGPSSAALVTLRPPAPVFEELPTARPLPLHEGLGGEAARRYLIALAEQKDIHGLQRHGLAEQLAQASRGHPLVLEKLAALAGRRPLESILRSARELKGDYLEILRAVMDWSLEALDEGARQALACLPVFGAGSCTPAAWAAALDLPDEELFPRADALRAAALVTYVPRDAPHTERYRWHASVSDYARAALPPAEPDEARRRAVEQICAVFGKLPPSDDPSTRPDLMEDLLNLYLLEDWALAQPQGETLARMATAPRNWWTILSFHKNWQPWLETALQKGISDKGLRANVLKAIGDVQQFRDERDAALASYQEALKLYRAVGDRLGEANVLQAIGDVQQFRKQLDEALKSYGQALALFREIGAKLGEANVLKAIGDVQQFRDERDEALKSYGQALALFREIGDRLGEANVLQAIGDVQQFRKQLDEALKSYGQALALFREIGAKLGEANVLKAIGDVQQFRDERDEALKSYGQALALFREIGDRLGEANVLQAIGDVQQFRKQLDEALKSYGQALALFREIGDRLGEANVLAALTRLSLYSGDIPAAEKQLEQVIAMRRAIGSLYGEGADYGNFAIALLNLGHKAKAKEYAQRARKVFEKIGEQTILKQVDALLAACEE